MDLGAFYGKLVTGSDFLIGRITPYGDDGLKIAGSGVIKQGKLVGWLGEQETKAAHFIMGDIKGGEIVITYPEESESVISFEVAKEKTKLTADMKEGTPYFAINIKQQCNISELQADSKEIDEKMIKQLEKAVSDTLERQITETIKKVQKEYKADVFGFGDKVEKYHYKDWKNIEKDWDKIYPNVPVEVNVTTKIRGRGAET